MKTSLSLWIIICSNTMLFAQSEQLKQNIGVEMSSDQQVTLRWDGVVGRSYFLQISDPAAHLQKWYWAALIEQGFDQSISREIPAAGDKGFYRLVYEDVVPRPGETLETADFDGDGISNWDEISPSAGHEQSNPLEADSDGDGMSDGFERMYGLNPGLADGQGDLDGDGLTNLQENQSGTDPTSKDSDQDGMPDFWEILHHLNPNDPSDAALDADEDGISNLEEFLAGTNPEVANAIPGYTLEIFSYDPVDRLNAVASPAPASFGLDGEGNLLNAQ